MGGARHAGSATGFENKRVPTLRSKPGMKRKARSRGAPGVRKDKRAASMKKWRGGAWAGSRAAQGGQRLGRGYLQGLLQVPAGLVERLLGCTSGVAHSFQIVYVLQAASFLLFFLLPYLVQFL